MLDVCLTIDPGCVVAVVDVEKSVSPRVAQGFIVGFVGRVKVGQSAEHRSVCTVKGVPLLHPVHA